jgi:uridine kinase
MNLKLRVTIFFKTIAQHKKLFFAGVIIKLFLGTFLASDYLVHLFTPFLKYSTTQHFFGGYDYFTTYGRGNEFPYPSVMLIILCIPKYILSFFSSSNLDQVSFIDILSVRIALFVADCVMLYVLLQWLKKYTKQVMWLYWLSPILIYINYIHGQLDVIPVALLFVSLYYLFKNKFLSSCIYLALAIGCKTSIFLAVPFILIYGYKNLIRKKIVFWQGVFVFLLLCSLVNLPLLFSNGFKQMVYQNAEQLKLFSTSLAIGNNFQFLLVPAIYLLLAIRFAGYWQMSRNLLLMYLGFAFGLITIFIAANQGWYYWCMPFFIYFVVKEYRYSILPFILLNVFYFIYFGIVNNSDYLRVFQLINKEFGYQNNLFGVLTQKGYNTQLLANICSTLLQASIIGFCYFIYRYGISQIQFNKMLYQPYLIGIAGDSATGKTTLANHLQSLFGKDTATVVNGDDMHKWERGNDNWQSVTHLNPKANWLHLNMLHTLQFIKGAAVQRQQYSHETGTFTPKQKIDINRIVIFEGLHSFYLEFQKQLFDLKIYMKPSEALRVAWKVDRDIKERGHEEGKVLQSIASRKPDAMAYVEQQEIDADVVVSYFDNKGIVGLNVQCTNHFYLDEIIDRLQKNGVMVQHEYSGSFQLLQIEGSISKEMISSLANGYNDELEALGFGEVNWKANNDGILQLILVQVIFYKMQLFTATHSEGIV